MNDYNEDRQEFSAPWFVIAALVACAFWVTVAWLAWAGK